jgi:hypothetical protein
MLPNCRSFLLIASVLIALTGCSKMISTRTDEQAWLEYQVEIRTRRQPASGATAEKFSKIPVRTILLECHSSQTPESCYRSKVVVAFDAEFKSDPNYQRLQKEFLTFYSYARVVQEVESFHQVLLSGISLRAAERARALHVQCESSDEVGTQITKFLPYLGGDTDIPKSYYQCLNDRLHDDQVQLLQETGDRLGLKITTEAARVRILETIIHPTYEKFSHEWFRKHALEDQQKWKLNQAEIKNKIEPGETLASAVARLSRELRPQYRYMPLEVAITSLYQEWSIK